jgi:hypothetical protein
MNEPQGTYVDLISGIKNAVQAEVAKINAHNDFENGAIRVLIVPKCPGANEWFGGLDGCEYDFVFHATPGGSHTRPAGWRDTNEDELDCSGSSALQIQGAAYALKHEFGDTSSSMPESAITRGRSRDTGCVVTSVGRYIYTDNIIRGIEIFMRVYVSVSGGTGTENEHCACAGINYIYQWSHKVRVPAYGDEYYLFRAPFF